MSSSYFQFKQFTVYHDRCAMKVGTDGVLVGALAEGGTKILDIGTGSGLIALMMAQRFPAAEVVGIDIDQMSCMQAEENVVVSPFAERIKIVCSSLQEFAERTSEGGIYAGKFDCIVCNPPFYEEDTLCPDDRRSAARHTSSLPFCELLAVASDLLTSDGTLTIIVPTGSAGYIEEECAYANLFISRRIHIKTTERKEPRRTVLTITKSLPIMPQTSTHCLMTGERRSDWYEAITRDFYLW